MNLRDTVSTLPVPVGAWRSTDRPLVTTATSVLAGETASESTAYLPAPRSPTSGCRSGVALAELTRCTLLLSTA